MLIFHKYIGRHKMTTDISCLLKCYIIFQFPIPWNYILLTYINGQPFSNRKYLT